MSRREKQFKKLFENKIIESVECPCVNEMRFSFTDGSSAVITTVENHFGIPILIADRL